MRYMFVFVTFLTVCSSVVYAGKEDESVKDYASRKTTELAKMQQRAEGHFDFTVAPLTLELLIADEYPKWQEKRYSHDKMVEKAKDFKSAYKDKLMAWLVVAFTGDWQSKGETSKKIPDDIAEYIFLENDKGKALPCESAEIPMMGSSVNTFNKLTVVQLKFSTILPDTKKSILEPWSHSNPKGTKKIKFVVGGLGLKNKEFEYEVPFSKWFLDAPPALKKLYYDAGIWKKP